MSATSTSGNGTTQTLTGNDEPNGQPSAPSLPSSCIQAGHDDERNSSGISGNEMRIEFAEVALSLNASSNCKTSEEHVQRIELSARKSDKAESISEIKSTSKDQFRPQRRWTLVISLMVVCIPFVLIGCTLAFPSGALLDLTDGETRTNFKLTKDEADLFGALGSIGAIFGGPISGWVSDRIGRKTALMLVSFHYLTGYMMITYARFATDSTVFKVILLTGRFISGFAIGWGGIAATVYVVEISPAKVRGRIGSAVQVFLALGVLIIYALSAIENFPYHKSSLVLIGFVVIFTVLMPFLSETPRWLIINGQKKQAIAAIKFLCGPKHDIDCEFQLLQQNIKATPQLKMKQILKEFTKGNVFVPMILALLLVIFFQCGGLNSITAYSALVLKNAGVPSFRQISLFGTGCTRFVLCLLTLALTDKLGRRPLLIFSSIGTFMGTLMLGTHFYLTSSPAMCAAQNISSSNFTLVDSGLLEPVMCNIHYAPLAIIAIAVYNIGFSVGWGLITWLLIGELLPSQIRGVGSGVITFVMWGCASLVVGTYLSAVETLNPWFVWWSYSIINFFSILFLGFCIFETKGKSLEDIQKRFESKYGHIRIYPLSISRK